MNIIQHHVYHEVDNLRRCHELRVFDVTPEVVTDEMTESLIKNVERLTQGLSIESKIDALADECYQVLGNPPIV